MALDAKRDLERLITFNQAARFLPEGSRPSYATWWRWWRKGIRGVRLRTLVCGGRRYTTRSAIEEFITALTAASSDQSSSVRTPRQRERSIAKAERELGIAPVVNETSDLPIPKSTTKSRRST